MQCEVATVVGSRRFKEVRRGYNTDLAPILTSTMPWRRHSVVHDVAYSTNGQNQREGTARMPDGGSDADTHTQREREREAHARGYMFSAGTR